MSRKRLLIIGCGDVARRALPDWLKTYSVSALMRSPDEAIGRAGVRRIAGDLDRPESLAPLAGSADLVAHLAPPQESGQTDLRTRNLLAALTGGQKSGAMLPQRIVYISTSGVYGDCGGALVDETWPLNAGTERALRRVDAETTLLAWGRESGVRIVILRVPGIYAADRLPLALLRKGTPVLIAAEDVFTNHVHADDLAAIMGIALEREDAEGAYNASDDGRLKMGDWFDLVADRAGLPRPPRISREEAAARISPGLLSFMSESRRLVNLRMKQGLGVRLRYPTVREGVPQRVSSGG